jgi:hypothetical protein
MLIGGGSVMTTAGIQLEALVRGDGVRREIYRDPEVFALEMERRDRALSRVGSLAG